MTLQFQSDFQPQAQQTIIVPVGQNQGQIAAAPLAKISQLVGQQEDVILRSFKAGAKEVVSLPSGDQLFVLLGLGTNVNFSKTLQAFQHLSSKHSHLLTAKTTLLWPATEGDDLFGLLSEAAVNGLWQGSYHLGRYKTSNGQANVVQNADFELSIVLPEDQLAAAKEYCQRGLIIAQAQTEVMALVNAPANYKHPHDLAAWAKASAEKYGYQATIWDKEQITKAGMHALLAVNYGSPEPPAFIFLEYKGPNRNGTQPKIGLVGKGVTFDTGGLSIKPSTNMHYMKSDMGGAAAVLGTMEAAARLKLPVHLVAAIPSTDNSVDALAVKPSDVISSYSGKSIEIIDTDAEGRLILADGLSYVIREHAPQVIIDLATLTGSSVRTFGYQAAALFSNDDQLAHHLEQAGRQTGERVWRLPIWEEYGEDMKSDVADIKNFSGRPVAGAITAAKFLEFFTDNHPSWAHLDIAGTAFGDTPYGKGKAATGYGIRLLIQFLMSVTQE
jgi:leucyl aminopeptidase